MTEEAGLDENVAMLDMAKAQLEGFSRQQELLRLAIDEHMRAKETLKRLSETAPGEDILVPIGADSFLFAKASDNRDSVVGVGAGVSIRRSPEDAQRILEAKMDELSNALGKVAQRAAETEAVVQELSVRIQEQYERLRSEGKA